MRAEWRTTRAWRIATILEGLSSMTGERLINAPIITRAERIEVSIAMTKIKKCRNTLPRLLDRLVM